jgi:hypothetical protein
MTFMYIFRIIKILIPFMMERLQNIQSSGKNSTTVQRYQPDYPGWTLLEDNIQPTTVGAITVKIEVADSSETGFIDADAVSFVCAGTVFEANEEPVGA